MNDIHICSIDATHQLCPSTKTLLEDRNIRGELAQNRKDLREGKL